MNFRKLLMAVPLLAVTVAPSLQARDHDDRWRRDNYRDRQHNERGRLDRNRDGVIERREWRGSNRSFSNMDRNRDGVISRQDRYTPGYGYYGNDRYRNNGNRYGNQYPYWR